MLWIGTGRGGVADRGELRVSDRMGKMSRMLALVHLLADSVEGLTLDEMAAALGVNRRTAERMRDVIAANFDLEERTDERHKRFRIAGALRRVYTRPSATEVAALQAEVEARTAEQAPRAALLASLLQKVKGALDDREKRRIEPDLDALVRLQRTRIVAGPLAPVDRDVLRVCIEAGSWVRAYIELGPSGEDEDCRRVLRGLAAALDQRFGIECNFIADD